MTGEHDYDISVQPFCCRRCGKKLGEAQGNADPSQCDAWIFIGNTDALPLPGIGPSSRHRLIDAESDGSIAKRLAEIRAQEGRA